MGAIALLLLLAATTAWSGSSPSCPSDCKPSSSQDPLPQCCSKVLECAPSGLQTITIDRASINVTYFFDELFKRRLFCKLRTIDVRDNSLRDLAFLAFTPNVTRLKLPRNKLRYIAPGSFDHTPSVEYLDLSGNELFSLDGVLDPLKNLSELDLSRNKLRRVVASWFATLTKLTRLDVSSNGIVFIPADTLQPLVSLSVFGIAENPLIDEDLSLLLGTGTRLEVVDASRTGLSRIPSTLTRSVRNLILSGNQVTSLMNGGDLDSYPLLRLLDLSHNRLTLIEDDALGRLENLEQLLLRNNILPEIPKSLPSNLKHLDLSQNVISTVKLNDLQGLGKLTSLDLSGNIILQLVGGFLTHVPNLEKLDISDNLIGNLPPDTLSGPTSLAHLKMSGLVFLGLEKNQNHDTAFPILALERLVTLDVSGSPVLAAQLLNDEAALGACQSLEELDLSYADISSIEHDLDFVLPRLKRLNLTGNAWNCSEEQIWLGEWMRSHEIPTNQSAVCKWPPNLVGKFLTDMPKSPSKSGDASAIPKKQKLTMKEEVSTTKSSTTAGKNAEILTSDGTPKAESFTKPADRVEETTTRSSHTPDSLTTRDSKKTTTNIPTTVTPSTRAPLAMKEKSGKLQIEWTDGPTTQMSETTTSKLEKHTLRPVGTQQTTPKSPSAITSGDKNKGDIKSDLSTHGGHVLPTTTESVQKTNSISTMKTTQPTQTVTVSDFSTVLSTRNSHENPVDKSEISSVDTKKPSSIREAKSITNDDKSMQNDSPFQGKRMSNQLFHEFKRSKLLSKNQEVHFNSEPESVAEKLNGQTEESETHTSESATISAHPGMLILLGAAVGAVAALSVILSRRATVNTRDQQYQRHENIEVHTLTPTTELW